MILPFALLTNEMTPTLVAQIPPNILDRYPQKLKDGLGQSSVTFPARQLSQLSTMLRAIIVKIPIFRRSGT